MLKTKSFTWFAACLTLLLSSPLSRLVGAPHEIQPGDPAQLVAAPKGFEIGHVPIATRQTPLGFPRMTMWWPYWKSSSPERVAAVINDMVAMHQSGVVLMGMQWGNKYALPPGDRLHAYLQMFVNAGIRPYLGLWVNPLTQAEADTAVRAWEAGAGLWRGIVLDAEAGWKRLMDTNPQQASTNFAAFMARIRPLTPLLAYAPYGVPSFHRSFNYNLWNNVCDLCLPQIYFSGGQKDAAYILNRAFRSFSTASQSWDRPAIPMVPLGNLYSTNADAAARQVYADKSLQEKGAVSWWRYPVENPAVRAMLATIPRDP